jgi:hypothetical protein
MMARIGTLCSQQHAHTVPSIRVGAPFLLYAPAPAPTCRWTGGHAKRLAAQLVLLAWLWALRGLFARLVAENASASSAAANDKHK